MRTNVSIVKSDHSRYLKVNEAGPNVATSDIEALTAKIRGYGNQATSGYWPVVYLWECRKRSMLI